MIASFKGRAKVIKTMLIKLYFVEKVSKKANKCLTYHN